MNCKECGQEVKFNFQVGQYYEEKETGEVYLCVKLSSLTESGMFYSLVNLITGDRWHHFSKDINKISTNTDYFRPTTKEKASTYILSLI